MSSDSKPGEQLAVTFIIIVLLAYALTYLAGCASAPFRPEPAAPDAARIAALLAAPAAGREATKPASFELRAPRFAMWGATIVLTCFAPESLGEGRIRLALEGVRGGWSPIEHAQTSLTIPRMECGTWKATCQVEATGGERYAEVDVKVKGGMCEADEGR